MSFTEIISIILAILCFAISAYVGFATNILRESSNALSPYSFHKFQFWLWTTIIIPCFALNWGFVAPTAPNINLTSLILLGISVGNIVFAEVITGAQLNANPFDEKLKALSKDSKNFWSDILKDDNGQISVARLQNLLFTFIYVAVYLTMFFQKKEYPDFEANAYLLMGVSTGTYLVGKTLRK